MVTKSLTPVAARCWLYGLGALVLVGWGLSGYLLAGALTNSDDLLQALPVAVFVGGVFGLVEIFGRYRDEPWGAAISFYGSLYVAANGLIGVAALFLLKENANLFGPVANKPLVAGLLAGAGGAAVLRTRIGVLKDQGATGGASAISLDFILTGVLQAIDIYIDRERAERRQKIVLGQLENLMALGSFAEASERLKTTLLAFQHLDGKQRNDLNQAILGVKDAEIPLDAKYLALGFMYLTLVGEAHFEKVVSETAKMIIASKAPAQQAAL